MPVPTPRVPIDDVDRESFVAAFEALYDSMREGGRAQLQFAALMAQRQLGGTLYITLPSRVKKRDLPEAGYIADASVEVLAGKSVLA